jgi:hypothetical protein
MLSIVLLVTACSKADKKPVDKGEMAPAAAAKTKATAMKKPSADIPEWASIEVAGGAPARPIAWVAGAEPTLAVFSASWCPGCTASAIADRELSRVHGKDFQVGVALQDESDEAFSKSPYAQALSGVPVWSESTVEALSKACHPMSIPSACLYENGQVLWAGDATDAPAVAEAHKAGKLDAWLASGAKADDAVQTLAETALQDQTKIPEVVAATHGRAGWQNSIAWDLVDRERVSPGAAALAVALSRDAVASDGGIDFAHLDTYALALAKAGKVEDAAYVGERVIAVCAAVQGHCSEEKRRAEEFIERARGGS